MLAARCISRANCYRPVVHRFHLQGLIQCNPFSRSAGRRHSHLQALKAPMDGHQTKLWIDCDAGVDDAQGILMAVAEPGCSILGVSCVFGNAAVDQVARNVCRILTLCGRTELPVYVGCADPLVAEPLPSNYWFGRDGLGDAHHARPTPKDVEVRPQAGHAAVRLVECARENEGQLTVVALGPLTNLALACKIDPALPSRLRQLVVMGSSEAVGNVTPTAEFNYHRDPEAAQVVMAQVYCKVETQGSALTRGMAVYDWNKVLKQPPNVELVTGLAMEEVLAWMDMSLE